MTTGRALLLIFALLMPPGIVAVAERSQKYPRRLAEVVPDKIFRGGFPTAGHIRNLVTDKGIKTVVSLTGLKEEPKYVDELEAVNAAGLRLIRIAMPGNGCGHFEDLDRAAEAIGDQENWPVFFHCAAGKQRSNAALAAYRLRKCGWTIERTLSELEADHGLDPDSEKALVDHLRQYSERVDRPNRLPKSGRGP